MAHRSTLAIIVVVMIFIVGLFTETAALTATRLSAKAAKHPRTLTHGLFLAKRASSSNSAIKLPRITISASDVAAAIGQNKWRPSEEILEKLWQKHQATTFETLTKTEEALLAVQADVTGQASKLLEEAQKLAKTTKNSEDTVKLFTHLSKQIADISTLTPAQKEQSIALIQSEIFTQHGIQQESSTVTTIKEKVISQESKLLPVDQFYSKPLIASPSFSYVITGKIDCLELLPTGEMRIYEIKNRTNRLFKSLVDYERIQVNTYQHLTGFKGPSPALLVENFKDKSKTEMNMIEVPWDEAYYNGVLDELKAFATRLDTILTDGDAREEYLRNKKLSPKK